MANEIIANFSMVVRNGSFLFQFTPDQLLVTQHNIGRYGGVQTVSDEPAEAIDFGDVIEGGWLILKNVDPTNYVRWGPAEDPGTGAYMVPCGLISPGCYAVLEVYPGVTLMADAYSADMSGPPAAAKLEVNLLER
jgi:hypothetical protein